MSLPTYPTRKDQQWFYLCIIRTLLGLNFAVIGNFTFRNVEGPVLTGCTWPSTFGNVQFSNSIIHLLHICIIVHILSVFVFIYTGKRKRKITTGLYVGEGSENRPFWIWDPSPRPIQNYFLIHYLHSIPCFVTFSFAESISNVHIVIIVSSNTNAELFLFWFWRK